MKKIIQEDEGIPQFLHCSNLWITNGVGSSKYNCVRINVIRFKCGYLIEVELA